MKEISGWVRWGHTVALLIAVLGISGARADDEGFKPIFDGKSLDGWDGNPDFWRVEDGVITGQTTADKPTKGNTFLIWRGGEVGDFEMKVEFRIEGGNSGVQYRSFEVPDAKWVVGGYQADIDSGETWSGTNYGERFRGILAKRGDKTVVTSDGKVKVVGKVGDAADLQKHIKQEDWNEYHIIARGNHFVQKINGHLMSEVTDEDEKARDSGIVALQLHAGPPMKVQFRNIRLKQSAEKKAAKRAGGADKKKVVFLAGKPSHGYGAHEHYAGCRLLADALKRGMPNFETVIHRNGWPEDESIFEGADAVVIYCDGGGGHLVNPHLDKADKLMKKGIGLGCIHYAVEVPKGPSGEALLDWIGGYFEPHWSVNPHWTAEFDEFPDHPITRGVKPFKINDEWYYHMRFREGMEDVTPILTDVPPESTLTRPDGPHSGNPHVRESVGKGEPQHMMWAATRPDGGRGFGFTGGHVHWNWGDDNFRRVVLNAVVWIAKGEVPDGGVPSETPSRDDLEKDQDYPKPGEKKAAAKKSASTSSNAKAKFASKTITAATPGHAVDIDVDLAGAKELYLVVTDGGNGYACDWADWAQPRLIGPDGEKRLTELKWKSAATGWGQVHVNKNAEGGPLRIAGKSVEYGIGTHANSVIAFDVPAGYNRFKARGGLDNGGTDQGGGGNTSVEFLVFTSKPQLILSTASGGPDVGSREPEDAVAGLDVADGLEATLFASEPAVTSLANLDVDHRGRVWVCDIVNYRGNNGKRPEGDRILILEDTDGDGVSDVTKTFYQGRDIDTALGICVLGNRVIVSVAPNVFVLTDEDGDDKADKKEVLFSKVGMPQHDHSTHSFVFGPDGKFYWNVGNTGQSVHDKDGNLVVDMAGNQVVDNGKPYFGGRVFRCNPDGSQFEVLGHNFRNNYEVAVDSFGTLWQSDNDDDGNRGVRINYVMEFGNFGYLDEKTGAGWKTPRTGMHEEIPLRHWHLNDPGVVPNLLQTGAGSPTGIMVYEGSLLPEVFQNQVIHCDAGPNIVRAYPATKDGAGYRAQIANILDGTRDKWFRPADVAAAPDGSLFVTDWYDPGVGGHQQRDLDRGRLFRIAPPGGKYEAPKFDFTTTTGAIEALKNANLEVRYLAWTALHAMGEKAEPALLELFKSEDSRHRARALWLLGKIPGRGEHYVDAAIEDSDSDIRIVGVRLARQLGLDVVPVVRQLTDDPSPQVRRDGSIALRFSESPEAPEVWADLAARHDGQDRWYLEALGIGAELKWDACFSAWLAKVGDDWNTPAGRDIIWRSRAEATPEYLARIIANPSTSSDDLPRYFRSFDFLDGPPKQTALVELALTRQPGDKARQTLIATEAVKRLGGIDLAGQPQHAAALDRVLDAQRGTSQLIELVGQFNVAKRYPELLAMAQQDSAGQLGVDAMRMLLAKGQIDLIATALGGDDPKSVTSTIEVLGNSTENRAADLLTPLVNDRKQDVAVRREAVRAMAKIYNGAVRLINMSQSKQLDEPLRAAAALPLSTAPWPQVRDAAAKEFPLPAVKGDNPLPPLPVLVKMKGDVARGKLVYEKEGTCAKCHKVNGEGKEVGPDLSGIGKKLSREALFESILYPSAGISHNYETHVVVTDSGNLLTGIITSRTADSIMLKAADALIRTLRMDEIEEIQKQPVSLMPADLQKILTAQDLVDVVEYLTTLKQAAASNEQAVQ